MDNDSGWAAQDITLAAPAEDGHRHHLTMPCRWVELVQAWDGQAGAYFLVSGVETDHVADELGARPWESLAFKDAAGKAHRFHIGAVTKVGATSLRLMRSR